MRVHHTYINQPKAHSHIRTPYLTRIRRTTRLKRQHYKHNKAARLSSPPRSRLLQERTEFGRFYSNEYWSAFARAITGDQTWRSQNVILLKHLCRHRDRLAEYPWSPPESWLVGWVLYHMQRPMRDFLVWSLHEVEENEEAATISRFSTHLEIWARLFEHPATSEYIRTNLDYGTQFFPSQHKLGGPWPAHYLASDLRHECFAKMNWRRLWRQYLMSPAESWPYEKTEGERMATD